MEEASPGRGGGRASICKHGRRPSGLRHGRYSLESGMEFSVLFALFMERMALGRIVFGNYGLVGEQERAPGPKRIRMSAALVILILWKLSVVKRKSTVLMEITCKISFTYGNKLLFLWKLSFSLWKLPALMWFISTSGKYSDNNKNFKTPAKDQCGLRIGYLVQVF